MRTASALPLLLASLPVLAAPWEFSEPQTLAEARPGVFHHLESAGRQGIAVSGTTVAIVWEDNSDGTPRAYVAFRDAAGSGFRIQRLSGAPEAYEPVATALANGRFAFGWEEGGQAWMRTGSSTGLDPAVQLSRHAAAQVTLGAEGGNLYVAWAERRHRHAAIHVTRVRIGQPGQAPRPSAPVVVTGEPNDEQLYPSLVVLGAGPLVAWEDRRAGHTRILYAHSRDGRRFSAARLLNELRPGRSDSYGRGTGAARVVLARAGAGRAGAVWLDKRDFEGGYDIYSAETGTDPRRFGTNRKVQDEFGGNTGQWHATLAAHPDGLMVSAWDDDRDGSPDLWLSWRAGPGENWSVNLGVPGASGPGLESSPVATLDRDGNLHLAWIGQTEESGPSTLRYLFARRVHSASGTQTGP